MDNIEIGGRLKQAREKRNMTQEELGKLLGLNKSTIQRYESGQVKKIKLPVLENIAEILGVNPSWLILKTDNPTPIKSDVPLTSDEIKLLAYFRSFNEEGQEKLLDTASDMAQLDRYKKGGEYSSLEKEA